MSGGLLVEGRRSSAPRGGAVDDHPAPGPLADDQARPPRAHRRGGWRRSGRRSAPRRARRCSAGSRSAVSSRARWGPSSASRLAAGSAAAGSIPGLGQRVGDPVQRAVLAQARALRVGAAEDRDQGQAALGHPQLGQLGIGQQPLAVRHPGAGMDRPRPARPRPRGRRRPRPGAARARTAPRRRSRARARRARPCAGPRRSAAASVAGGGRRTPHGPVRRGTAGKGDVVEQRLRRQLGDPVELVVQLGRRRRPRRGITPAGSATRPGRTASGLSAARSRRSSCERTALEPARRRAAASARPRRRPARTGSAPGSARPAAAGARARPDRGVAKRSATSTVATVPRDLRPVRGGS